MRNGKTIRIPPETETAIKEQMPGVPLSFAALLILHKALKLKPPVSPEDRKAAGGRAASGEAKNPHRNKSAAITQ